MSVSVIFRSGPGLRVENETIRQTVGQPATATGTTLASIASEASIENVRVERLPASMDGTSEFGDALRVAATSPAVNAGASAAVIPGIPAEDVTGAPRPQGAGVDIGAYEQP